MLTGGNFMIMNTEEQTLYKQAFRLSLFTIFYNIAEGLISIILGYSDETLSLFGFGADSFIEVLSGSGIALMLLRIKRNQDQSGTSFENAALRVTGTAFFLLSAGLFAGIIVNITGKHKPESTFWGIVVSVVSIAVMFWLMQAKRTVGKRLNSDPILADAGCTRICLYMSLVLLISSLVYELTGFAYADSIGAAGLIYFSVTEGKEALEKVAG